MPFYFPSPLTRCQPGKWRCQPAQDSSRVEASYVAIPQRFGFLFAPISLTTTLEDLPSSGHCNLRWPRTSYLCDRFGCKGNLNAFEQIRTCSSVRTDLSRCVVGKTGALELERHLVQPATQIYTIFRNFKKYTTPSAKFVHSERSKYMYTAAF